MVAGEVIRQYVGGTVTEEVQPQERHPLGPLPFRSANADAATDEAFIQLLAHAAASADTSSPAGRGGSGKAGGKAGGKGAAPLGLAGVQRLQLAEEDVAKVRGVGGGQGATCPPISRRFHKCRLALHGFKPAQLARLHSRLCAALWHGGRGTLLLKLKEMYPSHRHILPPPAGHQGRHHPPRLPPRRRHPAAGLRRQEGQPGPLARQPGQLRAAGGSTAAAAHPAGQGGEPARWVWRHDAAPVQGEAGASPETAMMQRIPSSVLCCKSSPSAAAGGDAVVSLDGSASGDEEPSGGDAEFDGVLSLQAQHYQYICGTAMLMPPSHPSTCPSYSCASSSRRPSVDCSLACRTKVGWRVGPWRRPLHRCVRRLPAAAGCGGRAVQ